MTRLEYLAGRDPPLAKLVTIGDLWRFLARYYLGGALWALEDSPSQGLLYS